MKRKGQHEPIALREKRLSDGGASLYLDRWVNGRRKYEFLKLYIVPEHNRADREKNRRTRMLAEAIRARRVLDMQSRRYGIDVASSADVLVFPYVEEIRKSEERAQNTRISWASFLLHLRTYEPDERITFDALTPGWIRGFCDYLNKASGVGRRNRGLPLSDNSKILYFTKLRAVLHKAVADGILLRDPSLGIKGPRREDTERTYLTVEEVRRLTAAECSKPRVKDAFLFSCLTGLRWSDVTALRWKDVQLNGALPRIVFTQQKTRRLEYMDISPQAVRLLGERGAADDCVFVVGRCMPTRAVFDGWAQAAGIDKYLTFHCARHTFATMMLSLGIDIYTVSKLLGHRKITTTQIYAKVLDKAKQEAVRSIPSIFQ
ncbi:MAG: site-specific integrase [Bacteroidales bacterium]|nr:site-specific integrase [Bacteroidales bacterium]